MREGDVVGDFALPDQDGAERKLSELVAGGPVVLFFYPAAMTTGCTAEACHFRDLAAEFGELGAQPVGISADQIGKQQQFAAAHGFGFPLLSDVDGAVARQFGVKRRFGPIPVKRHTFVIDEQRRVLAVIRSEFRMGLHADKALEVLKQRS
ncbi:peroxiredoxin Q/BCP [Saccharopolyspora antimicrobica]|uniref:thioredoxin-dependent peroxiredoxin n=1 Tax=Saccharopolyspora antimicrobica TaxID=455193 RepID=A0A1I5HX51_9PSEU|nr:peroxiredoxin [Saccharopolyspora antimicrobica]RKT82291.1 peroxiredoxin Q/BCP [Saccharopolyspora antimicrobica]SFO52351.1 peroxiredoxin Q/BCP [Saccharopolyspora antimicrobica]